MVEVRTLGLEDINHENSVKEERELRPMLDWELFEE
jgi:ribosomal protein L30/L7E